MLKITEKQHKLLEVMIPNLQEMIEKDDLSNLLDIIDDLILNEFSNDFETLSPKGTELQIIYDRIYHANKDNTGE